MCDIYVNQGSVSRKILKVLRITLKSQLIPFGTKSFEVLKDQFRNYDFYKIIPSHLNFSH